MWPPAAWQLSVQFGPATGGGECVEGLKIVRTPHVQPLWGRRGRGGGIKARAGMNHVWGGPVQPLGATLFMYTVTSFYVSRSETQGADGEAA